MKRRPYLQWVAAAGATALAGCSGTGSTQEQNTPRGTETSSITMVDRGFDPTIVRVSTGTAVTWTNEDGFDHDVVATTLTAAGDEWSFESGPVASGEGAEHSFDDSGSYEYYCSIHGEGTMCGVVLVGDEQYDGTLPCASENGGGGGYY